MTRLRRLAAAVLLAGAAALPAAAQTDAVARARALAAAGQRIEAIALLQQTLSATPLNHEARATLGTVLSWEGRYDEARRELEAVLLAVPADGDVLTALINVELWSSHPERADSLAQRGLLRWPDDTVYLLARARALVAMKRAAEAASVLDHLLRVDPRDPQALTLRRSLAEARRVWQARAGSSYDMFSGRGDQRDAQVSLSRATPAGPVLVSASRTDKYGLIDHQIEIEMYPRIRRGTYAYVAAAYSPDAVLYPRRRLAAELYQSLGGGFEGSAGLRRLSFGEGVSVYVGSLTKYLGNWMLTGRIYLTPGSAGTSWTFQSSARRYFGESGAYAGLQIGRGALREEPTTLDDFDLTDSRTVSADGSFLLGRRLQVSLSASYGDESRIARRPERRVSLSSGMGFRF